MRVIGLNRRYQFAQVGQLQPLRGLRQRTIRPIRQFGNLAPFVGESMMSVSLVHSYYIACMSLYEDVVCR